MLRVHINGKYTEDGLRHLRTKINDNIEITAGKEIPEPADYSILVDGFADQSWVQASPDLQAVIVPFAGVPAPTCRLLRDYPAITLHNLHYNVVPTAETAMALLLAAVKFVPSMDRELRANDWSSRYADTPVTTLHGKRALILGYGNIGRYLTPICSAFGMHVIGIRREAPKPGDAEETPVYPPGALHQLLPHADILINVLPLTPETHGMIGEAEFDLLPDNAILVNIGRGETVDETALYQALTKGRLLSAAIDVWYHYPRTVEERTETPPSQYPFHQLDNVVMSPHRAGFLSSAENKRMEDLADLLNHAASGDTIPNLVNKELGY